jgi:chromosome segregation ATPase
LRRERDELKSDLIHWKEWCESRDLRKENEALVKRREHDINHIEQLCRERNDLKIELSNYAYQIDRAKRDRDKAESKVEVLRKENERLKNDLLDALDLKSGSGPTTLTMLKAEIKRLTQSNKELVEALKHSLSMMEQTLSYRENTGLTAGNIFLSSTIEQAKNVIQKSKP